MLIFLHHSLNIIYESYVLGIGITHASPRQHIVSLTLLDSEYDNVDNDSIYKSLFAMLYSTVALYYSCSKFGLHYN